MCIRCWGRWLGVIGVFISVDLNAQNYFVEQALLFSRQSAGGSARIQAMGGAQVALGGDFSSALSNPAALGMYNRNEVTISPALTFQSADATYTTWDFDANNDIFSTKTNNPFSSSNVSLPGLSIVFGANKSDEKAPFLGGTFAITLNRINDFNGGFEYRGQNNSSSIIDYFLEASNGYTKDQFNPRFDPNRSPAGQGDNVNTPAYLGYNNYLIGPASSANDTNYYTDVTGKPFQSEIVKTSGSQNQWNLSYGANFNDKFFFGGGLGITSVRYGYDKTYSENYEGQTMLAPCNACFNNLKLKETRTTTGTGINLTLGALVKPVDFFQFGLSYVTPTAYQLTDTYTASMTTSWNNYDYFGNGQRRLNNESYSTEDTDPGNPTDPTSYSMVTPSRFTAGAAIFIPKKGFITADVEFVNYSKATTSSFTEQLYSLTIDAPSEVNNRISSRFQSVTNLRFGAEYRINKFRLRAGYNIMADPYVRRPTDRINYSLTSMNSITGGLGYRDSKFFVDVAVINTQGVGYYVPYAVDSPVSPSVDYNNSTTRIQFTVGFPF
ncbi:MAG: OmpP1/FadL family transporter [bacterium]|jgi:hypothetical protein